MVRVSGSVIVMVRVSDNVRVSCIRMVMYIVSVRVWTNVTT